MRSSQTRDQTPEMVAGEAGNAIVLPRWQRWMLPATLGNEGVAPDAEGGVKLPRSARDWIVDAAMFGAVCISLVSGSLTDHRMYSPGLFVLSLLLGLVVCAAFWLRRRNPLGVALGSAAALVLSTSAVGAAFVALLGVAVHCRSRRAFQVLAVLALATFLNAWLAFNHAGLSTPQLLESLYSALGVLALGIVVVIVGTLVRVRRELVFSLRAQADRLQSEQELRVRDAQLAERSRIAREMHDVLSHRISLLSLYAGALEFNPNATPEQVAQAAGVIRTNARAAQEELREVIGVLRFQSGDGSEGEGGGDAVRPPQPTVADIAALVAESEATGMNVTFASTVTDRALSVTLQRTIYRVVQEGLTNARKHAPGQLVDVRITDVTGAGIEVRVVNRPAVGAEPEQPATFEQCGSGTGLVGLAERARLCGGSVATRALSDGGFELVAKLPVSGPEER